MAQRVAVTGATGFLGRYVTRVFLEAGWDVRILTRRDPIHPLWRIGEVEAVFGRLEDDGALRRLCADADLVVHVAGLVKARSDKAFHSVNVGGSEALARAINAVAPSARAILVSSLAARAPHLSPYAASKQAAEVVMARDLPNRLTIVRPTAIYGPGDRETFQFIAGAAKGWPLPLFDPRARLTLVHVDDVAREILAFAGLPPQSLPQAISDARPDGYDWRTVMTAIAGALGMKPRFVRVPATALKLAGLGGVLVRQTGLATIVTPGKVRELLHNDWSIPPDQRSISGHAPVFSLDSGFFDVVTWAKKARWLS